MDEQSPFVSSSEHPEQADKKPWGDLDVLDLTGGAGAFRRPEPARYEDDDEEEEEKPSYSDSLEPSPEEEEPSSISEQPPAAPVVPSAPLEEEAVSPPVPRRAPTGSVDENLFTLPAASAPLTHSSADKVLDLQQPYSTMSAGQEELASMLLEPASASSPLSPLSADSSKEQVVSVAFHANITSPEALPEPDIDTQEVSRTIGNLALTGKVDHQMEADYADDTYHKQMSSLGQAKTDVIFSEKGYIVEHPTSQQETVSEDHSQLYAQSAKEMFSGMLKSVGPPHEEFSEIKETLEQYVDFKPFVSMQPFSVGQEASVEQFKSNVYSLNVEAGKMPEEKYEDDEDLDLSDISPITPEVPDSPAYEMFAQFGKESQALGNKTDERKMEEIGSKATSVETTLKFSTANPFYEHLETQGGYVATKSVTESAATQGPTVLEGLTPDIVQEAYESETHDIGVHKLGFESKIDLVQTATKSELENAAKSVQENVSTTAQTPELFEGTNSVSSPVLPDIVMEAPLAAASTGLVASPFQPDVSPTGGAPSNSEEKIKLESEKPPSYEEAVSKSGSKNEDKAASLGETKKEPAIEDAETPYISIACDLIKETIATESTALDFSKAIKDDFESHFDDSSPESEHSEPSYKHWEHDIVLKEAVEPVKMERLGTESEFLFKESSPDHTYFDSFQPKFSQGPTEITTKNQDKPTQLHGLGFGLQSGKTPSPKYSPIEEIDDFEKASPISFEKDLVTRVPHDVRVEVVQKSKSTEEPKAKEVPSFKKNEDVYSTLFRDPTREKVKVQEPSKEFTKAVDLTTKETFKAKDTKVSPPPQEDAPAIPPRGEKKESKVPPAAPTILAPRFKNSVVDLLYWRDIKKSGAVFGASLFLLLSLTVFSIVSVVAYIALALLSVTISFRIYKGVLQAIQKSDDGHPFRSYLDSEVAVSEDLVQKYSSIALNHVNCTLKELRRLFLVEDLVDSLKFAVLMWVFTYIGALFNGLTLLILALISLFSIPVIYERHQTKIDHYLGLVNKNVKNISDLILAKIPGLKRKTE